jgi:hypothetical protein
MDESMVEAVRARAGYACEYCRMLQTLHPGSFEQELITEGLFPPA